VTTDPSVALLQHSPGLSVASPGGRWLLGVVVLGTSLIAVDGTVVRLALPAIGTDLHADFSTLQWIVTAYTWTLASVILLGGAAGDRYGRRRIFLVGVAWFSGASLLCATAPSAGWLVTGRLLQGVGAALLAPASMAVLQASYRPSERGRAIGAWVGLSGLGGTAAPFLAGWLLDAGSWRWVFLISPLLSVPVVVMTLRHMPETRDTGAPRHLDLPGALLGLVALGALTYATMAAAGHPVVSLSVLGAAVLSLGAFLGFWTWERRARQPMLPPSWFRSRQFTATNAVTFLVYGAINGFLFLALIEFQVVAGFSALVAGVAFLPSTALTLLLSSRSGRVAARIGPRLPLTVGPLVCASGILLALRVTPSAGYLGDVVPAVTVFGVGLVLTIPPLNASVLAAVSDEHSGLASGVNNAVACAAGLLTVAALPAIVGLTGERYTDPAQSLPAFRGALVLCAGAMVAGGALAAFTVRNAPQGHGGMGQRRHPARLTDDLGCRGLPTSEPEGHPLLRLPIEIPGHRGVTSI
jgi:EmrB/QacA subfamily drug resistance transporter